MPADTLLHIADLHFWQVVRNPLELMNKRFLGNLNVAFRRGRDFDMAQAEPFADKAASLNIPQILLTGDFSSTATESELAMGAAFTKGFEARGIEVHLLAGNHDFYTFESQRKKRFEKHFEAWLPEEAFPARRTLAGGTPLILVPTVCPNLISSKGRITGVELKAVAECLQECPSPLLVAGHYPVLNETAAYRTKSSRRLRNAQALREILGDSGKTILYVAGHVHRFSFTQDDKYSNLSHLTTGAFFHHHRKTGIRGEFSEIRVDNDDFEVVHHIYRNTWTAEVAARISSTPSN